MRRRTCPHQVYQWEIPPPAARLELRRANIYSLYHPPSTSVHCIALVRSPELALLIVEPRILLPLFGLIRERSSKFGQFQVDAWHILGFLAFMTSLSYIHCHHHCWICKQILTNSYHGQWSMTIGHHQHKSEHLHHVWSTAGTRKLECSALDSISEVQLCKGQGSFT